MNEKEKEDFVSILEKIRVLRLQKSCDYGTSWKVFGLNGILYQVRSKFVRIMNLTEGNKDPKHESLRDSFMDLANYSIMAVQLIDMNETEDKFSALLKIQGVQDGQ